MGASLRDFGVFRVFMAAWIGPSIDANSKREHGTVRAFTLVEVLTVVAIAALLAALIFPALGRAKRAANKAVATSNMHQCSLALSLYAESADGGLPPRDTAYSLLGPEITYDPNDNWRGNRLVDPGEPLIGSFGYVLSNPTARIRATQNPDPVVLVDIFNCDKRYPPFTGDSPPDALVASNPEAYSMPHRVLVANLSGSVGWRPIAQGDANGTLTISWSWMFIDLSQIGWEGH